jgi:hypothetical protein
MKMEQTVFRNVGIQIQTPGNYPEENIQHSQNDGSLKSRILQTVTFRTYCIQIFLKLHVLIVLFLDAERKVIPYNTTT